MRLFNQNWARWVFCAACGGACAGGAVKSTEAKADGADGDLMVYVENGDLVVGRYDFDGGTGVVIEAVTEPVIIAELEANWEGGGTPGGDEPGIATDGSSPGDPNGIAFNFPANTPLLINANLLPVLGTNAGYWDGTGAVSFGALPNDIVLEDPFFNEIDLDGGITAPSGTLTPWQSDLNGTAHDHIEFLLAAPDATAAAGIYLLSLTFQAGTAPGSPTSEPLYYVLGYGGSVYDDTQLDGLLDTAEAYVDANIVPEPATLSALALAGLGLMRRRSH